MLRPVSSEAEDVPGDVQTLARSLHDQTPAPTLKPRSAAHASPLPPLGTGPDREAGVAVGVDAQVPVLDRWSVQAHVYSSEIAGKLGILAGLFGGSGRRAKAGATHEAKRYRVDITETQREVQVGVAVRLAVATTEWKADLDLSVPNIAAAAQLHMEVGDAKIGIDIVGYSGPLGSMLPAPRQLDVTTLADYLAAFASIQHQVFGPDGLPFLTPAVLSYDDPQVTEETTGQ